MQNQAQPKDQTHLKNQCIDIRSLVCWARYKGMENSEIKKIPDKNKTTRCLCQYPTKQRVVFKNIQEIHLLNHKIQTGWPFFFSI